MKTNPIIRSEHIMKLSREHHFSLLFCWKINQGLKKNVAPERIISYVQYFWQHHMQLHFTEEENILYVPVHDNLVAKAVEEHATLRQLVEGLQQYPNDNTAAQLSRLTDLIDKHIRFEERELFPHLEKTLEREQLDSIAKQLNKVPATSLKDSYADEFWNERTSSL
jgi:hemerythrin-like domain-containing protein